MSNLATHGVSALEANGVSALLTAEVLGCQLWQQILLSALATDGVSALATDGVSALATDRVSALTTDGVSALATGISNFFITLFF